MKGKDDINRKTKYVKGLEGPGKTKKESNRFNKLKSLSNS